MASPKHVIDHILKHSSETDPVWREDVELMVEREGSWHLYMIDPSRIELLYPANPGKVESYRVIRTPVPAVVISDDGVVIDGVHRCAAAAADGKKIKAWMPTGASCMASLGAELPRF